jgi:hypothetical protein
MVTISSLAWAMHENISLAWTHGPLQIPCQCLMKDLNHRIWTLGHYPSQLLVGTHKIVKE